MNRPHRRPLCIVHCAFCIALAAAYASADTDICGNEIRYDGSGNVTYQFIVSGDPRPESASSLPAPSQSLASNDDVGLVALVKSVLASMGGSLTSKPLVGFFLFML